MGMTWKFQIMIFPRFFFRSKYMGMTWKSSRLFLDIWQNLVKANPCAVTPSHKETLMSSYHSTQNLSLRIKQAKKVNILKVCITMTIWFTIYPLTLIWKTLYSKILSSLKMYLICIKKKNQTISMYIIVRIQFLKYRKICSHNQIH